jgi:YD repeat-containing protein
LKKVEEFTGVAPSVSLYSTTNYNYDVLGNLTSVEAEGVKTTMRYDTLGRKIAMSDPDMGSCGDLTALGPPISFPWYPAPCWNYLYDANGNLIKQIDAHESVLDFTYDALNRVVTKAYYDLRAPSVPGSLIASPSSSTQINLDWTVSTDNIGVSGYRVERCQGGGGCSNFVELATVSTNSYNDTGLTAGTSYIYRVRTTDAVGNMSSYSNLAAASTPSAQLFTLTLTRSGTGAGTVTSTPAGINCGATCSGSFNSGTSVTLTATPNAGSTSAGFSGGCSSATTTCTFTITANTTVTATFNGASTNTGLKAPTANAAETVSAGDNNGYQSSPGNVTALEGLFAIDTNSGNGTGTSCTGTDKDKHRYYNYDFSIPSGSTIRGITVLLDARVDNTAGTPKICVQISWDGGTTWTTAKETSTLAVSVQAYTLGGATDTWGRSWSVNDFTNTNFRVRVINVSSDITRDFLLDRLAVQVDY